MHPRLQKFAENIVAGANAEAETLREKVKELEGREDPCTALQQENDMLKVDLHTRTLEVQEKNTEIALLQKEITSLKSSTIGTSEDSKKTKSPEKKPDVKK